MKVLALIGETKDRSLIQNILEKSGHQMIQSGSADQAIQLIEDGEARFIIVDADLAAVQQSDLLRRIRAAKTPPVYFLAVTSTDRDLADADDTVHRPLNGPELKARIMIGQRFLSLGDSLTQARDRIENMAIYDNLTGLMNRGAFYRTAQGELERARRAGAPLSLIVLDIDNFKAFNEKYGVEWGDEVLRVVSQTIREKSRPYDCIGRWSGDEFIIALSGVIGADAEKIAGRIISGVQSTGISYQENTVNVTLSVGIASTSRISTATEADPLIQQARQALARAKEDGGNQVNLIYT